MTDPCGVSEWGPANSRSGPVDFSPEMMHVYPSLHGTIRLSSRRYELPLALEYFNLILPQAKGRWGFRLAT